MGEAAFWQFVAAQLQAGRPCALLLVAAHTGSSPGRRGFKMAVTADDMHGSIGGGIMEHKFVELVRARLAEGAAFSFLRHQVHSKDAPQDQSGMICSGSQTLLVHRLQADEAEVVAQCCALLQNPTASNQTLRLDPNGMCLVGAYAGPVGLAQDTEGLAWHYHARIVGQATAYVVGGGHVGLAMCRLLAELDFRVVNIDDRPGLHTMQLNQWAETQVLPYPDIDQHIPEGPDSYVIVMSFGYRTDAVVMRQLLGRQYAYLGMMGSQAKVTQLWAELAAEGFAAADIAAVSAPAGLPIGSQTPAEIAVSIAAELIQRRRQLNF